MKVLVVDDQEDTGEALRDSLFELGHQPVLVRSAEAALGKLHTEQPDAIILDLSLPGMSGLDFLRLRPIRESGVPIVAVSGVATEHEAQESLRLGALEFVGKPVAFERLQALMVSVEPRAVRQPRADDRAATERRRAPRVKADLAVRIVEYTGRETAATSIELSAFGMKLRTERAPDGGAAVKLAFTPDGGPAVEVVSLLLRVDADGPVFSFVDLPPGAAERLNRFVEAQAARPGP